MKFDWTTFPSCETCPNFLPNLAHNCHTLRHNIPSDCPKDIWVVQHKAELREKLNWLNKRRQQAIVNDEQNYEGILKLQMKNIKEILGESKP